MITVVFATKNGQSTIGRALRSFSEINTRHNWNLVIIDNDSNDGTVDIINEYRNDLPITLLTEKKPGKNNALNSSIPFLIGDLVVFTDDDVAVPSNWIDNITDVCNEHPEFDIFAGDIIPEWEVKPENWILDFAPLGHLYAVKGDYSDGPCDAGKVWGPNMVVRKNIFESESNKFNVNVGPNGSPTYAMGSETEFTKRMEQKGYKCWNSKRFSVAHWVAAHSLNRNWIMERAYRLGKGVTLCNYELGDPPTKLRIIFKLALFGVLHMLPLKILGFKRKFWFTYKFNYCRGSVEAMFRKSFGY
jgi:glycosyltransferase involved in cell wall biosynthesis